MGSALTPERRDRLVPTLRALDGRLSAATHPEIAAGLFDIEPISKRDWISHELRDRTGRLVRRIKRLYAATDGSLLGGQESRPLKQRQFVAVLSTSKCGRPAVAPIAVDGRQRD